MLEHAFIKLKRQEVVNTATTQRTDHKETDKCKYNKSDVHM
jgi:hypothetical protein